MAVFDWLSIDFDSGGYNDASVVEWLDLLEIHYYAGSISTAPA